ncbi:hypothetical protein KRP22_014950 [Phytophthora ramorum]|nr:hypothetical protein KRP22_13993 [Phytophthora ramorum]
MEKKSSASPPSLWWSSRRWYCWLPRILLAATVVYASVALFWSAHSIGAFTFRLDVTLVDRNSNTALNQQLSAESRVSIRDFPSGETRKRNLHCIGWRATSGCSPEGARQREKDENCTTVVSKGKSGYCEVEDVDSNERFRVMRRHCNSLRHEVAFKCEDAPEFVNFQVDARDAALRASEPSFALPNVAEAEETPLDGIVMVVYPKLLASAYYEIQLFHLALDFEEDQKCYGRRDVYRNPHFYTQDVAALNFSALETQLRYYALQSTQFSPDT